MFLFLIFISLVDSRKNSNHQNASSTETTLNSISKPTKTPRTEEPVKNIKKGFATKTDTYPLYLSENFELISAQNASQLDKLVPVKCNQRDEMDLFFAELENKCLYIIFCCGPDINPEKILHYMPRRNSLVNRIVQER